MHPKIVGSIVVLALVAFAAGCGGDEDGETGESADQAPSLTKAQFVKEANKICLRSRDEILERLTSYQEENGALDPSDIGQRAVGVIVVPVFQGQIDDLRALGQPKSGEGVDAYLEAKQSALDAIQDKKLSSNQELFDVLGRSDGLARKAGIGTCAFG